MEKIIVADFSGITLINDKSNSSIKIDLQIHKTLMLSKFLSYC